MKYDAKVMFSKFASFCQRGGGGGEGGAGRSMGGGVFSQKVLMTRGQGQGVFSWKVLMTRGPGWAVGCLQPKNAHACGGGVGWGRVGGDLDVPTKHCCLHVISLLTCCQKEELETCTCLYSHAARHSGKLPPPPPHTHLPTGDEHFVTHWIWALWLCVVRGGPQPKSAQALTSFSQKVVMPRGGGGSYPRMPCRLPI